MGDDGEGCTGGKPGKKCSDLKKLVAVSCSVCWSLALPLSGTLMTVCTARRLSAAVRLLRLRRQAQERLRMQLRPGGSRAGRGVEHPARGGLTRSHGSGQNTLHGL